MNIKSIFLFSHDGRRRDLTLNPHGLNIITGRSSTGKSALSYIIEFCMGRSTFRVPEGIIREKVSWFGIIYQFESDQIMVVKPIPAPGNSSSSRAMLRRGDNLEPPDFDMLVVNSDDDTVVAILSNLLGIPENQTDVPLEHSRASFTANIKHCLPYLFQKQGIITNNEQLLYRQNEPHYPQTIRDTLPILLGASSSQNFEFKERLRNARRDLKLSAKRLEDVKFFTDTSFDRGNALLSEAKAVEIVGTSERPESVADLLEVLRRAVIWKPGLVANEESGRISRLEDLLSQLRVKRRELERKLKSTLQFSERTIGYTKEANEQLDRLASIKALPWAPDTGEWQWPFSEKNLGMSMPIAEVLLGEIQSLAQEMKSVVGDRPKLDAYISDQRVSLRAVSEEIRKYEQELASALESNEMIEELESRNTAASRVIGRISLFLEDVPQPNALNGMESRHRSIARNVEALEKMVEADDGESRMASIVNNISAKLTKYIRELDAEHNEFLTRFDVSNLTVVADRPGRPIPLDLIGGAENQLAYHLSTLLALHQFAFENQRPIPRFLLIDQPSQVYFPSAKVYAEADGTVEKTKADADLESVRRLFEFLHRFTQNEAPGFQIIVTEHANLAEGWFQDALVEERWAKPPALVPDDWPYLE